MVHNPKEQDNQDNISIDKYESVLEEMPTVNTIIHHFNHYYYNVLI